MGWITQARRRQISAKGRQMVLSSNGTSVTLKAYSPPPQAAQLQDGVAKAAFVVEIMADEVNAQGLMPAADMEITDGPKFYTLTDAVPIYDGPTLCGWRLIAAGGQ